MRRKLQRIEDVDSPEVGRFYLVPCVARHFTQDPLHVEFWPVIGPWHEDTDIGFAQHHFHYDGRFLPESVIKMRGAQALAWVHSFTNDPRGKRRPYKLVYLRRMMKRPMPDFPGGGKHMDKLQTQFKNVRLTCKTCPHRGMSLKGLPVATDGTVVCNGHGLKWNLKTGEMVER